MTAFRWMLAALAVGFLVLSGGVADAQTSTRPCWYNSSGVCVYVSSANALPVTIVGGGGGGLSVTDGAAFTASSSNFTPSGGEYAATPTTCADGKQCTVAMTTQRAFTIDTPTSNNALYAAITAALPALNATAWNTNTYTTGSTSPVNTDLHGAFWMDMGAINGVAVLTGTGATGTGAQRVTVSTDQATNAGAALVKGGVGVVNGGDIANTIAASQTNQIMSSTQGGGTGATGDYLSHCVIQPGTTSPGSFTILDNATTIFSFPGGASSVSNLVPFTIPIGAHSLSGGWKITSTTNVTGTCFGKFT